MASRSLGAPWRVMTHVLRHWASERNLLRQGFTALGICISVTLVAGVMLGAMERLLEETPGLLVLVPSAIGMRGAIFGALGARLGTGILTGQYQGDFERGSFTRQNVEAAASLTVFTAGLTAAFAWGTAKMFGQDVIALPDLAFVSLLGAVLSSALVLPGVLLLARTAESRRWDMDAIGAPLISAAADITSLPALVVAVLLLLHPVSNLILGVLSLAAAVVALVGGYRTRFDLLRRVVRESTPVLIYAAVMQVLAGTVLSTRLDTLISDPALLVAIPPFIAASGALGGILSARLSSQLHLGLLSPARLPPAPALLEGTFTGLFGVAGYTTIGLLTALAAVIVGFSSPGTLALVGVTLIAGMLAIAMVFLVAFYVASASFHFGLDPDNYGFPTVAASMDFLGIVCLIVGIGVVGV